MSMCRWGYWHMVVTCNIAVAEARKSTELFFETVAAFRKRRNLHFYDDLGAISQIKF